MKTLLLLIFFFNSADNAVREPRVATLRSLFYAAERNKAAWVKFADLAQQIHVKSEPILLCYRGVSEMVGAKYAWSPVAKLHRFKKGKAFIERAVDRAPDNLEIRFLRFSVQTNLPSFLGYNDEIPEDKRMLLNNIEKTTDIELKNNVLSYLSSSKYCTVEERKILLKWKKR